MSKSKNQSIGWLPYLANLSMSTVGGTIIKGYTGGMTAFVSTVTDEYLIERKVTAKHYLTSTALWTSIALPVCQILTETFPEYILPIYGAGLGVAAAIAYFGNDPLNYKEKIIVIK